MAEYNYLNGSFSLHGNNKQNKNAIMDIQRASGVKADGIWGQDSQAAYSKTFDQPTAVSSTVQNVAPKVNASHTTIGGFGELGTKSNGGYPYANNTSSVDSASSYKPSTDVGSTNWFGGKDQTYAQSQNELSNSFHDYQLSTGDKTTTLSDYQKNAGDFQRNENQQFNNYAGLGLGAAQLGASLYSTFGANGSMAMNKKNMELMDGQIANNNEIMSTRKARASDIQKYFG